MSSDSPTSSTVISTVEAGLTKDKATSLRCKTCKLSERSPDVTSSVERVHAWRCGGALEGIVTSTTNVAMLFGAPVTSSVVALRLAPTTAVAQVLGSAAKGVLFHCKMPLLGNSDWTV